MLAALRAHQRHLVEDYANTHSLVAQRLADLDQDQWTFPDLANHLLLSELEDALSVVQAVRMDGAAFAGLVARKGTHSLAQGTEFFIDCPLAGGGGFLAWRVDPQRERETEVGWVGVSSGHV